MTQLMVGGTRRANPEFSDAYKGWVATVERLSHILTPWERRVFNCARKAYTLDVDVTTKVPKVLSDELRKLERRKVRDDARIAKLDAEVEEASDVIDAVHSLHLGAPWVAVRMLATVVELREKAQKEEG